jgi:hypothetical protein
MLQRNLMPPSLGYTEDGDRMFLKCISEHILETNILPYVSMLLA